MYKAFAGLKSCFAGGVLLILCSQDSHKFLICLAFGLSVIGGMFLGAAALERKLKTYPNRHTTDSGAF
jgi:hypothetical protein